MKINFNDPLYAQAKNILLLSVDQKKPGPLEVDDVVRAIFDELAQGFVNVGILPKAVLDYKDELVQDLAGMYLTQYGVNMKEGRVLGRPDHTPWVEAAISSGALKLKSYEQYDSVILKDFSKENRDTLKKVSSSVLDYMGNPKEPNFKSFGLLMGDVQSGKTATFTGICHMAVDAGYKMIIVLTGTRTSLRNQTQSRLDRDLIGIATDSYGRESSQFTNVDIVWNKLTTSESDFTKHGVRGIAPDNPNQVTIAVIQKNKHILDNLYNWLSKKVNNLGVHKLPLLMVDDEADSASVNVNKEEEDPSKINAGIRRILDFFDCSAYLAVTATPFANIFIDPQIDPETGEIQQDKLPDLFPRDFIYALDTSSTYYGVERLFGRQGDDERNSLKYRGLIPIRRKEEGNYEDQRIAECNYKAGDKLYELPSSLRRAVLYFLCACTLKEYDSIVSSNTSMLVHIARYTNLQNSLKECIDKLVKNVAALNKTERSRITSDLLENPLYSELQEMWDNGLGEERWYGDRKHGDKPLTCREITGVSWQSAWRGKFRDGIKGVAVIEANTNSKIKNFTRYYENNDGKVIVVGGDALSRGLTLEGLCVSYFSRRSFTYDTLLQMGRWFGYRASVEKYMKVWISDCLIDAYGYIAEAVDEFRQTLKRMREAGRRPIDFGLRIRRTNKMAKLMVTSANKRRTAKRRRAWIPVVGEAFQASTIPKELKYRKRNLEIAAAFLKDLGPRAMSEAGPDLVWKDVSAEKIADLLVDFIVPNWSNDIEIEPIAARIKDRKEQWTVRVVSLLQDAQGKRVREDIFGLGEDNAVICSYRTMIEAERWIQPGNRAIVSQSDFGRHWSSDKRKAVLKRVNEDRDEPLKELNPRIVLNEPGEGPQLLIYPLRSIKKLTEEKRRNLDDNGLEHFACSDPIVSIAFGIPGDPLVLTSKDEVCVEYDTNLIYQLEKERGYSAEGDL